MQGADEIDKTLNATRNSNSFEGEAVDPYPQSMIDDTGPVDPKRDAAPLNTG